MVSETETPVEVSIEEQRRIAERDARFAEVARQNRERTEVRRAAGQPTTVKEMIESRFASIARAIDETPSESSVRIAADDVPMIDRRSMSALRAALVPRRFVGATLDNFTPHTTGQAAALGATRAWLERARAGESAMLALVGPQGTGKSHLLYAAANALLDAEITLYARPWYVLADELRYGGHHPISNWPIEADEVRRMLLRPSWKSRVWLLDEVRPTSGTMFDDTELTKLACFAYDACCPVMITTNVNPLADVMGAPAASRFRHVVIDGPDARQP